MKTKFAPLLALLFGLGGSSALAQTTPPVLTNSIIQIQVTDGRIVDSFKIDSGGTGYVDGNPFGGPPSPAVVTVSGGGGNGLVLDPITSGGSLVGLVIDPSSSPYFPDTLDSNGFVVPGSGGSGFTGPPTITITGGGTAAMPATGATAEAFLDTSANFSAPFQNEVFGPAGDTMIITSLAEGTHPASGFTYKLQVNGLSIGETNPPAPPGTPASGPFTPPLPGVYIITSSTQDGNGNTANSQAIRYFATGTAIVSPEAGGTPPSNAGQNNQGPGTLVPVGSSIVIQATSTPADGFISRIDFYTDWNGTTGTKIGTGIAYPYSVIYTPAGPANAVHVVKALAYDNNGVLVPASASMDQITLTMTTPSMIGLPSCVVVTPTPGSLLEIPDYAADASASIPIIVTAGAKGAATITKVELYINGVLYLTSTTYPYVFNWTPTVTGLYSLTALAYDNQGNVIASVPSTATTTTPAATNVTIEAAPAVAITLPGVGQTLNSGSVASVTAVAFDTNLTANGTPVTITQVQFFQDGTFVGVAQPPASGNEYTVTFKPTVNLESGVAVPSILTAVATDTAGFTGISPGVQVNVTAGGTGSNKILGTPPTVSLTTPLDQENVIVNTPVTFAASANAPNGNVQQINFLVDNTVVATASQYPYSTTYTFKNLGFYSVEAQVIDNLGDSVSSPSVKVNVVPEPPPTIAITSPAAGGIINVGNAITVTASGSSPSGTIAQVQFFENGVPIGTATTSPYTATFTPMSAGVYILTAIATDNAGEQTSSTPVIVEAIPTASGLGTTTYFGQYQGLADGGRFAFIVVDGKLGTYISHSTSGSSPSVAFYSDLAVNAAGTFSSPNLTGNASAGGINGTLLPSQDLFIGAATPTGGALSGYYTGNLSGQATSQLTAIVGGDGSLMVYIATPTFTDVADGTVDSTGAFSVTTVDNNQLTGSIDPTTGFVTGSLSGSSGGTVVAAKVSGGTFSDGVLKNISTRGQVGTGANIMVAGFAVGGTSSKRLLIRAVGPTLSTFNLSGSIPSTQLQIFSGTTLLESNTGWSSTPANASAIAAADSQVGAFALPSGSADSALIGTFAPGSYTAQIAGVGGATGLALAEVYDLDTFTPFSPQRLVNVSTRGNVGTGTSVLIGGFSINGTAPKRLLIRGAGPSLTALNVSGALSAAHLEIFGTSQNLIRENFSWQTGNDAGLVASAAQQTGAFAFGKNSADAAILIDLPPGTYTAILSGATSSATGIGLVEVYEVP